MTHDIDTDPLRGSPSLNLVTLLDPDPSSWGLRGDPVLWRELRTRLEGLSMPDTEVGLAAVIGRALREAVGVDVLGSEERHFVARFASGSGMSDGWVDSHWWSTTGMDTLRARHREALTRVSGMTDPVATQPENWAGSLTLGNALSAAGVDLAEVLVIRHTYKEAGMSSPEDVTPENMIAYTRQQDLVGGKIPSAPPRWWLVFLADGGRRSRFYRAYENRGEVLEERTETLRSFSLSETDLLGSLRERLVIEWSQDSINWAKAGSAAQTFPIVEIADPDAKPFPGFDRLVLSFAQLQELVSDSRYASWRAALGAVQGIYLIADRTTGKLYVGKADGAQRILGRWRQYAETGHGGNVALREALGEGATRAQDFTWSLLRVFGSNTTPDMVDEAERHFKETLLTKKFGYNLN